MQFKVFFRSKINRFAGIISFLFLLVFCMPSKSSDDDDSSNIGRKLLLLDLTVYDYCKEADLEIIVTPDFNWRTVNVSFQPVDSMFKDCFTFYDVYLEMKNKNVQIKKVRYIYDEIKKGSHVFKDVPCGTYQVIIQPCYNEKHCMSLCIMSNEISMKSPYPENLSCDPVTDEMLSKLNSIECEGEKRKAIIRKSTPSLKMEIVIILAVAFVISIAVISGFIQFCCSGKCRLITSRFLNNRGRTKSIHVYILHYYDDRDKVKRKVAVLKDFLMLLPYCSSVTVIEEDLYIILCNVSMWFDEISRKEDKAGNLIKIILVNSQEDTQEEVYEMENLIFSRFIDRLNDSLQRHLTSYKNIFVVQFNGIAPDIKRFKNVIRLQQYFIPNCLADLCLNMCVGCELNVSEVKTDLKMLMLQHPIRNLKLEI